MPIFSEIRRIRPGETSVFFRRKREGRNPNRQEGNPPGTANTLGAAFTALCILSFVPDRMQEKAHKGRRIFSWIEKQQGRKSAGKLAAHSI